MANKLDKSARARRSFEQLLHTLFPDKKKYLHLYEFMKDLIKSLIAVIFNDRCTKEGFLPKSTIIRYINLYAWTKDTKVSTYIYLY